MNRVILYNSLVMGMPGKVIRERGAENETSQIAHAASYVEKGRMFKEKLRRV
jgi:carbonic anhydrase/acetyltransferase-like protein (isoleucine patch superfamily)